MAEDPSPRLDRASSDGYIRRWLLTCICIRLASDSVKGHIGHAKDCCCAGSEGGAGGDGDRSTTAGADSADSEAELDVAGSEERLIGINEAEVAGSESNERGPQLRPAAKEELLTNANKQEGHNVRAHTLAFIQC